MITIIAKKIDAKLSRNESNFDRMSALVKYCANPQSKSETEKCVAVRAINFTDDEPSIDRIIDEFTFDMRKSKRQEVELISHWVLSWKGGEPDVDKIFDSAKNLLEDLGYTEANRALFAIHADTSHIHCHIAVSKVDMWTGKINSESWFKNEAQKSLARIADKYHWSLEPGARYRVKPDARKEILTVKTTQGIRKYDRKAVTKCKNRKPSLGAGAKKYEYRTGLKSAQKQLQERLANFLDQNKQEMSMWKYGNFHRELSNRGIECKRILHKDKYYTAFSLDGENFFAASKVCPDLSYDNLSELLNGKSWRDARPDLTQIREEARKRHQKELELLNQIHFTREEIARLKSIPPEKVYASLGKKPKKAGKGDALTILASHGMKAHAALAWLAQKFPSDVRIHENPGNESLNRILSSGVEIAPRRMPRARQIASFMGAMHAERMRIFTSEITHEIIKKASDNGDDLHEISSKPMCLDHICKLLPHIDKLESYGLKLTCRPIFDDTAPLVIASDQDAHYEAPVEYPLPGSHQTEAMTLTVLAHGGKSTIRTEIDKTTLKEIPSESLSSHLRAAQDNPDPSPEYEKARYKPYEPEHEALSVRLLRLFEQQKQLLDRFLDDRQRAWALADALYRAGATPNQVYTALGESQVAKDMAVSQMPVSFTGSTSEWQRKRKSGKPVSTLAPVDFSMDANAPDARPAKTIGHTLKEHAHERN